MLRGLLLLLAACPARPTPPAPAKKPAVPAPSEPEPPVVTGMPCGVESFEQLDPYGPPKCDRKGSCLPGSVLSKVGSCKVVPSSAFDLYAGRERSTIYEDGRPILSSDAPPWARTVVFDPRVPTPDDVRVGMTGADLEELFPDKELVCELDDGGWKGHLLCKVDTGLECDAEDASWILVIFDARGVTPKRVAAAERYDANDVYQPQATAAARALVRGRRIVAVDLGPGCGED